MARNFVPNRILPYQFEPRYNDEQLEERAARRRLREQQGQGDGQAQQQHGRHGLGERDQELQNRLEGITPVAEWCECGHCQTPQNPTRTMCVCCTEQHAVDEKRGDLACITNHPSFSPVCLTPDVLHMLVNSMADVRGYGRYADWTNRLYRLVSYRAYTYFIHNRLGRYNRQVIPACVVRLIRDAFPEENGEYVSYREAEEEMQDAWAL